MLPHTCLPTIIKNSKQKQSIIPHVSVSTDTVKLVDYSFCKAWKPSFSLSINKPQIITVFSVTNSIILSTRQGPVFMYLFVKKTQCSGDP